MDEIKGAMDEEIVYAMGQLRGDDENERLQELIDEALERGLLLPDDSRGNGWRLLDMDGCNLMPSNASDCVFEDKGQTWVFWNGAGRPHGSRMYSISDPLAEEEKLARENGPSLSLVQA